MIKKHFLSRLASVAIAATLSLSLCAFSAYADDVDTVYDENYTESDIIEEIETEVSDETEEPSDVIVETEDLQAIAGAFNDEKIVTTPAKKIKLRCGSNKTLKIGEGFQIAYIFNPKKSDDYVTYKSYDKTVALVTEDGYVTAVGAGTARILLKNSTGNVKVNIYVTVKSNGSEALPVKSISPIDENMMIRKGKTAPIEFICYPLGSSDTVTFTSADKNIATVNSTGIVTGINEGSTVITLKTSSGITAECNVTIYAGIYKGIDVSKWQGDIKWNRVKTSGIDFVMIRSSFGDSNVDIKLADNVAGCEKYDISYGFYHYLYATSVAEAKAEARFMLNTIKKYSPDYPIVLDIEESFYKSMSKTKVTNIICAFVNEIESAGYYGMVYSYASFFNDHVDMSRLEKYDIWVACWGDLDRLDSSYDYHYGMWQYSSTGTNEGINGDVDLNYAYKNYSSKIRKNGLNNL